MKRVAFLGAAALALIACVRRQRSPGKRRSSKRSVARGIEGQGSFAIRVGPSELEQLRRRVTRLEAAVSKPSTLQRLARAVPASARSVLGRFGRGRDGAL